MGTYNVNGTMLRWSDQLLLTAENHHFEGSTHLKAKECETGVEHGGESRNRENAKSKEHVEISEFEILYASRDCLLPSK